MWSLTLAVLCKFHCVSQNLHVGHRRIGAVDRRWIWPARHRHRLKRDHPVLQGFMSQRIGIRHAFILPAICYLYIVFYAFRGSKPAARTLIFRPPR
jgi:hypothetical protein